MQQNIPENPSPLNSAAGMRWLLNELVDLAGQHDELAATPVLELQFGDVVTRTTVAINDGIQCLSVVAELPLTEHIGQPPQSSRPLPTSITQQRTELSWHADSGRYVVVSTTPVSALPEDTSVLDAILDTSEYARAWYSVVSTWAPVPR
ncbi:MAG: hypothetical protein V7606_2382 [Burkholderiales bacterium]